MSVSFASLLYLVSGSLFILSLRGLSSPASSRRGNQLGMIGMGIAIVTTLTMAAPSSFMAWLLIIGGLGLGGVIGAVTARRIAMTAMPQLVAAFHSLVGLAAVFVAAERLFALHGFQNVSVRDITAAAGVNLASVNYHFGSKDALLFEIFRRRTAELNRERARMLHEAGGRHEGKPPVREILAAYWRVPRWA